MLKSAGVLPCLIVLALGCGAGTSSERPAAAGGRLSTAEFRRLMETIATSWNEGDARQAAAAFSEDAVYVEPPGKQHYAGRAALFRFFGGDQGRRGAMRMKWHHLLFDEAAQVGAGEFTFTYGSTVHGMVVVKIRDGLVHRWREYWYESALPWEEFIGDSAFDSPGD